MEILDSGHRKQFESGAVRDARPGVGRCDLLPLGAIGIHMNDAILLNIKRYTYKGTLNTLWKAITLFCDEVYGDIYTGLLEVSKQYEDGAKKYDERNWERGIPLHCFIDSGVRHYLKHRRGDTDEPHDRAFVWNILGAIWTHQNKPEMIDLPFMDSSR